MSGDLDPAGFAEYLTARTRWIAVAVFAAVTAVGVLPLTPSAPAAAAAAVVAVGAAALLVLAVAAAAAVRRGRDGRHRGARRRPVEQHRLVRGVPARGLVRADRQPREGLAYWAGAMILFAVEWLWVRPDPGWGAWLAGVTLTVAFSLLIRHDRDLLGQLRQAQAGLAEQAKTQERNRIARELHDVIGHTLTVCLLHVQSARLAVEHDPADAARALAEAERLGRECLAEVRTTVGMLREDGAADGAASTAPLPGAGGLPALVEQFRSAGADVTLTVEGDVGGLPATTGLAVYRIVQEALTNAAKHAPGSPTEVRLTVGAGEVTLTADSRAVPGTGIGPGTGTGLGVVSMRERAESLGGSCQAGPGGRGWLVRATLPLAAAAPAATMTGTAIRVLLVDDQELVRTGLRGILRGQFGFDVVGECADGGEVIAAVEAVAPDVVLMDVRMPFVDGVQATLQLKRREGSPPVLALTTFDDDQALAGMLRAGASGFVLKGVPAEDLQRAVRVVAEGGAWLDPAVTGRVLATYRTAAPGDRAGSPGTRAWTR